MDNNSKSEQLGNIYPDLRQVHLSIYYLIRPWHLSELSQNLCTVRNNFKVSRNYLCVQIELFPLYFSLNIFFPLVQIF
jgi:hypothetical protein